MEIGSSYTWELTEGNELTDGCFPMLPNGSMIVGTPSALTWNYTGVTEKTTDAKYNRGFCFKLIYVFRSVEQPKTIRNIQT